MDEIEVEQYVSDCLSSALDYSSKPEYSLLSCRRALECIIHHLHGEVLGKRVERGQKGKFPGIPELVTKLEGGIRPQTREIIFSVNAQTRGEMHFHEDRTAENAVLPSDVAPVVEQVKSIFQDVFSRAIGDLDYSSMSVSQLRDILRKIDPEKPVSGRKDELIERLVNSRLEDTLRLGLDELDLDSKDHDKEPSPSEELIAKGVVSAAGIAGGIGIDFSPWESMKIGRAAELAGKLETAEGLYKQALRHFELEGDGEEAYSGQIECLLLLGSIASIRGEYEECEKYALACHSISDKVGDQEGIIAALNNLAVVAQTRGDLDRANEILQTVLWHATESQEPLAASTALRNLGLLWGGFEAGEVERAEEFLLAALNISKEVDDQGGESAALNNLGLLALKKGEIDVAEEYITAALGISLNMGDIVAAVSCRSNLGNVLLAKRELDEAKQTYTECLIIHREIGSRKNEAGMLHNIGTVEIALGEFEEAEQTLLASLEILLDIGHPEWIMGVMIGLGQVAWAKGEIEEAERRYRESVRFAHEHDLRLTHWFYHHGFIDSDAEWEFPPPGEEEFLHDQLGSGEYRW